MAKEFQTSQFLLEDNYRSAGKILDAALKVIEQDKTRVPKGLKASHPDGLPVTLKRAVNPQFEANFIATEIARLVAHTGEMLDWSDVRTNLEF